MLVSFCVTGLALGKDDGDGEEDAAKAKPALPNFYLDMRTIYSTLPAGSLSIGFSTPPLLSTLANLSSLRTPTSPSSRSISVDLPLTVDVNDQLSVYGGVSGATSQAGSDPWTRFLDLQLYARIPGRHLSAERRNVSDHHRSIQRVAVDSRRAAGLDDLQHDPRSGYALNADETRGLLAGMQYARILVDSPFARVSPDVMGYVGGYYQWDNNWKLTGRFGVQSFGGAQLLNLTPFPAFTQPIVRFDLDRMDDDDNRLFGITAQIAWTPKPSYQLTLRTPLYAIKN